MNCKPGDLAYIVKSARTDHIGMVVHVEGAAADSTIDRPTWIITFSGVILSVSTGAPLMGKAKIEDRCLRPISGVPVHDEEHNEVAA